jgi:serine/threonine protein phosphatase PrpC
LCSSFYHTVVSILKSGECWLTKFSGCGSVTHASPIEAPAPNSSLSNKIHANSRNSGFQWLMLQVYDGHGGHQVAEFLAEHVKGALLEAGPDTIADAPLSVLGQAVEDAERQLLSSYTDGNSTAAAGSTLCAVLMIDDKLHVAHVGDSRAILARGSAAKQLTRDHKPACAIEAKRIMSDDPDAEITPDGYLYSELAVARAIGSAHLKRDPSRRALIATAETVTVQLQRQDDFVIVATDGLWDTVSNSEAVSVARRVLIDTKDAAAASRALVERAQKCGSSDNISVVTLLLHSRGITVPRSNSRLFKRTPSQQQSFAGASSSADGGSSLPAYTQPSAGASSGADGNSSNNSKATPA